MSFLRHGIKIQHDWKDTIYGVHVHVSADNAKSLVRRGGIINHRLIAYSLSNISAKNYQNRLMCVEVMVCNISVVFFETQIHREPKNTPTCLSYLLQNQNDSEKNWYIFFWVNLLHRNVNVFYLTPIMSLHYLVKLSIHVLQMNGRTEKNTKMFLSYLLQNEASYFLNFGTYFPYEICHKVV